MKLTINGVDYWPVEGTPFCWRDDEDGFPGVQLCHAMMMIIEERIRTAEILEASTEAMRYANAETARWKRRAAYAREVLRRIEDADACDSQDIRAIKSWCASFDAESVDL